LSSKARFINLQKPKPTKKRGKTAAPDRRSFSKKGADVRRQELIDATFRCLVELGVADTSVRTIAAEAGLSLGMVRHYFNSKDELLAATYRNMSDRLREQTQALLEATPDDPLSQLEAYINAGLQPPLLDRHYVRIRFLFFELTHTNPTVKQVHDEIYERFEAKLRALVKAVADMNGSNADCVMMSRVILTFLKGVWAEWTLSNDDFEPRQLVMQMMPYWLAQLGHQASPAVPATPAKPAAKKVARRAAAAAH
jgi:AcrR family transcriptional regulator